MNRNKKFFVHQWVGSNAMKRVEGGVEVEDYKKKEGHIKKLIVLARRWEARCE